jgi:hypothetical protein
MFEAVLVLDDGAAGAVRHGTVAGEAAAGVVAASWCDTAGASANKMLLEVLYLVPGGISAAVVHGEAAAGLHLVKLLLTLYPVKLLLVL